MVADAAEAQRAFVAREHGRLVGALQLYTGDRELAYELAQEALARACRDWRKVAAMAAPGAWVYRVALNLANSHFRRRRTERRAQARLARERPRDDADPGDAVAVRTAVAGLAKRQCQAVVLRYYAGLSVAETAAAMSCREGTVRALTAQGLQRLRTQLGGASDEEETRDVG